MNQSLAANKTDSNNFNPFKTDKANKLIACFVQCSLIYERAPLLVKVGRPRRFISLIRLLFKTWVWNIGGNTVTGENRNTRRKTCVSVINLLTKSLTWKRLGSNISLRPINSQDKPPKTLMFTYDFILNSSSYFREKRTYIYCKDHPIN
jgi:hypothetical protein